LTLSLIIAELAITPPHDAIDAIIERCRHCCCFLFAAFSFASFRAGYFISLHFDFHADCHIFEPPAAAADTIDFTPAPLMMMPADAATAFFRCSLILLSAIAAPPLADISSSRHFRYFHWLIRHYSWLAITPLSLK
jgi:hypothetical protein